MGIVALVFIGVAVIAYAISLWIINQKLHFEYIELKKENATLVDINREHESNFKVIQKKLDDTQNELAGARKEIWDYEIGDKTPTQKTRINEMKEYIFHLLQKQNVVMGINDEDKKWIRRLGGQIQEEAINE